MEVYSLTNTIDSKTEYKYCIFTFSRNIASLVRVERNIAFFVRAGRIISLTPQPEESRRLRLKNLGRESLNITKIGPDILVAPSPFRSRKSRRIIVVA